MRELSQHPEAVRSRKRYYRDKGRGICPRCNTRPATEGYTHCRECLNYLKDYEARQRAERRAAGQCIDCGNPLEPSQAMDDRDRCSFCEDKHDMANYYQRL